MAEFPNAPPGKRPRVEVRVLKLNAEGKLEELSCYPLDYYGLCPNVGDTMVDALFGEPKFYSVQRRYFVTETLFFSGWALIVREIDAAGPPLDLWEEWQDATKFWDDVADQETEEFNRAIDDQVKAAVERPAAKMSVAKLKTKATRKRVLKSRPPTK